jgi:hypothetical protein
VQPTHDLNVERLERVTGGLNEVHAGMDAVVDNVHAVDLVLGIEISIEALLDVLDDGAPGLVVVDKVTKSRSIDDVQSQTNTVLLNVGTDGLDGNSGGCEVETGLFLLLGRVERSVEQCVDESRLSKAGFTWRLRLEAARCTNVLMMDSPTTMTLKLNPFLTLLRCHWFGRLANPTKPVNFLRTMFFMSLAAAAAALGSL